MSSKSTRTLMLYIFSVQVQSRAEQMSEDLYYQQSSQQFHSDFVLYNEGSRRLAAATAEKPVKPDVNSNYLKLARSNSRITATLKKLLPRRKTSKQNQNHSEVNLTGIYNNNKYIIKVNNEPPGQAVEAGGPWVKPRQAVDRNKSFLLGSSANKVKRSNSVLPSLLGRSSKEVVRGQEVRGKGQEVRKVVQEHRTVVEVQGGREEFPWGQQEKTKPANNNR